MALLVALVGLTTFVVPLIGTDPPVLGQVYWSPLAIVQQTQLGVLPLSASTATVTAADLVLRYEDLLFGFLFAYGMLAAAFLAIVMGASVRLIRWTAGLCLAATLADLAFGHVAYQSALCAGGDGLQVHAGAESAILAGVTVLLLVITSLEELD